MPTLFRISSKLRMKSSSATLAFAPAAWPWAREPSAATAVRTPIGFVHRPVRRHVGGAAQSLQRGGESGPSQCRRGGEHHQDRAHAEQALGGCQSTQLRQGIAANLRAVLDRKSTRLNSSHLGISY